jgi:hypothetical protein
MHRWTAPSDIVVPGEGGPRQAGGEPAETGNVMSPQTILNGTPFVTLDDALAGETRAPSLHPEFSVPLVGILKLNAADADSDDEHSHVRLYPANGREDRYYCILKADIDTEHVELVRPEVLAARGWIADKVHRIRVRASAQVVSVQSRTIEAIRLSDEGEETLLGACLGTTCNAAQGWRCVQAGSSRACEKNGNLVPCPNCT